MQLSQDQIKFKAGLKAFRESDDQSLTLDRLEETAHRLNLVRMNPLSAEELREVVSDLTKELEVTLTPGGSVVDSKTFVKWIEDRKIETPRWDAYKQLLLKRDWEEPVVDYLHNQSRDVVELLGDPLEPGPWLRRGLLMGEVQSGKTANYIGILNLALDHGYKVIIVIGGHTNLLRKQTQARIDSDLLGIDSEYVEDNLAAPLRHIGVGEINTKLRAHLMTTINRDFDERSRSAGVHWIESDIPTVFVIKKNAKLIENVANYIRQQSGSRKLDAPLVVLDDESDWGTPNTRSEFDPTRVNKAIRSLLDTSTRGTYLGITATPFANIFIDETVQDPEHGVDLFPSDYIRVLSAPSTYFGISQYFLPAHGGLRVEVRDCLECLPITHKRTHVLHNLPVSLQKAVVTFLIGTAIRSKRSSTKKPSSMLVNVSRFNDIQAQVSRLIDSYLQLLKGVLISEIHRDSEGSSTHMQFVKNVWLEEFEGVVEFSWSEVSREFPVVVQNLLLELVNSQTADSRIKNRRLMTDEQRSAEDLKPTIFVGGDVLSRGLTLEGLQVSYFVREPRTMDTLMQMGRWFGYRPGYKDLVRVWLPESTAEDFAWSASVTEELRILLLSMKARGMTPREFGLRVRSHPEGFLIVAANKSKATKQIYEGPIVWQSSLRESFTLVGNADEVRSNRDALQSTIEKLEELSESSEVTRLRSISGYRTWSRVPLDVVRDFFNRTDFPVQSLDFGPSENGGASLIKQSLSDAKNSDFWDVTLVDGEWPDYQVAPGVNVRVSRREKMSRSQDDGTWRLANRRVSSGGNLYGSLTPEQLANIESETPISGSLSQKEALSKLNYPKLLIYLVAASKTSSEDKPFYTPTIKAPNVAVAVAYPPLSDSEFDQKISGAKKYTGNSVYLRNLYSYSMESDDDISEVDGD